MSKHYLLHCGNISSCSFILHPIHANECTQHVWPFWSARSNILDGVALCWVKFDLLRTFGPTLSDIFARVIKIMGPGAKTQHCLMALDSFEHSRIHHWSNTIQHHPTPSNNIGEGLTNMFGPFERAFTVSNQNLTLGICFCSRTNVTSHCIC